MIEATAEPSRALPVSGSKSTVRVGLATLAAGAVTTAAIGITWASANGARADTSETASSLANTSGIAAARGGAANAFTSRNTQRQNLEGGAKAAAISRTRALTAATDQVTAANAKAAAFDRLNALERVSANISREEERRKSEGWMPGGKNPSFLRPLVGGTFISPFGWRTNPVTGASELHSGQDIAAACGTPILAPQDGTVVFQGPMGSGGNALRIKHGKYNGKDIMSGYYHAERYIVSAGDKVTRGQTVGYVGSTGVSTGCHLQYMIYENGTNIDPAPFIEGKA